MKKAKKANRKRSVSIVVDGKHFAMTEAYKSLRSNLQFILNGEGTKKVLVTSSLPFEGKSVTAANLAVTLAQTGARVVIIDCDLRKGRMYQFFHCYNGIGISDALSGRCAIDKVIYATEYPNLSIIPVGTIPPNPAELLGSKNMEQMLTFLSGHFDYILMDTAPVNLVSDALELSKFADGSLFVVSQTTSTLPEVEKALERFKLVNSKVLGIVYQGATQDDHFGKYGKYGKYGQYGSYGRYENNTESSVK